jgi:hypothetical protein
VTISQGEPGIFRGSGTVIVTSFFSVCRPFALAIREPFGGRSASAPAFRQGISSLFRFAVDGALDP